MMRQSKIRWVAVVLLFAAACGKSNRESADATAGGLAKPKSQLKDLSPKNRVIPQPSELAGEYFDGSAVLLIYCDGSFNKGWRDADDRAWNESGQLEGAKFKIINTHTVEPGMPPYAQFIHPVKKLIREVDIIEYIKDFELQSGRICDQ